MGHQLSKRKWTYHVSMKDVQDLPPVPQPSDPPVELNKPHEMIVMIPRSKRVTLTGRRIYNALLQVSQSRLASMTAMPAADFMFEAPLRSILRTSGSDGEDRTAAKRYLREMRGLEVDWESTAPGDGVKWRGFSMLSEVAIEVRQGENWVSWSYPPTIMAALREPSRWARINLDVLANLSSYAAVALYEICARYRDNPSGVTSRKPVAWWADALSQAPAGSERREWRKFKNERVSPAVEEINAETDLEIELIEHKQGRAVVEAQFVVRKKKVAQLANRSADRPVDANLVLRAESLGIRELKLEQLIREHGEDAVRSKIEVVEQRSAKRELRTIDNVYAYLRSLLRDQQDTTPEDPPAVPQVTGPAAAAAVSADALKQVWKDQRFQQLKAEARALPPEQLRLFADKALADLAEKGMAGAVMRRQHTQGDYLHALLGTFVVRAYAESTYGPGWDQEQEPANATVGGALE
jgi:hypothetical protein